MNKSMCGIIALLLTLVWISDSMAFERNITRTGSQGRTSSRQISTERTESGFVRKSETSGPNGASVSRSSQGNWDPATQTWSKTGSATGSAGRSVSSETTATHTEDGYKRSTSVTGPQGNTATREAQGSWDPVTKTWTKTVTSGGAQ